MRLYFGSSPFRFEKNKIDEEQKERFHKNLFYDDLVDKQPQEANEDEDFFEDSEDYQSKYFKLNNLSLPLSDTIAEFAQDLSSDKFFLNDLSFIFEMSRKRAISPYAIIVALLYLKRLKSKKTASIRNNFSSYSPASLINSYFNKTSQPDESEFLSNTELCLVSILLASKYLIDEGETDEIYNDEWAKAADLPVNKINKLEKTFLKKIDWDLYVSSDEFWKFTNDLTEKITRKKVKLQLGNCTYSDLDALLSYSNAFSLDSFIKMFNLILKMLFVCSSTLFYVTLSTYLISNSILIVKNQLSASSTNLSIQSNNTGKMIFDLNSGNTNQDKLKQITEIDLTELELFKRRACKRNTTRLENDQGSILNDQLNKKKNYLFINEFYNFANLASFHLNL